MKKYLIILMGWLVISGVWADEGPRKLNVLTTTSDLKSITESVGGDLVSVKSICLGNQDPHFTEAKPSFILNARKADLFIKIGLDLEVGYESLIIEGARNNKIKPGGDGYLDVSENTLLLDVAAAKVDRSMGDVHPFGNPHYWLDPYNGRIIARNITERLKKLAPEYKEVFNKNHEAFIKKLDESMFGAELVKEFGGDKLWELEITGKRNEFLAKINELRTAPTEGGSASGGNNEPVFKLSGWVEKGEILRGVKLVMFHRSWNYFISRFGMVSVGEVEPKPGIPPGPAHLKDLIKKMQDDQVKVIMIESFYDKKSSDFVAGHSGGRVVTAPISVDGESGVNDYITLIDTIINRLVGAIKNNE
ncbi:MAG: metal ABC transporter substrate-binding protein [Planctomycetota bacterium]